MALRLLSLSCVCSSPRASSPTAPKNNPLRSGLSNRAHMAKDKAVFLDLNGTLVLPLKQERLSDLYPIPGAVGAVARLVRAGFLCPVITVQSRIAKGLFTSEEFLEWFRDFESALATEGAVVRGPYVCPHRFAEPCACKKPN